MRAATIREIRVGASAALLCAAIAIAVPAAQPPQPPAGAPGQGGPPGGMGPGGGPPPKPLMPAAASSIAARPDSYIGQSVTVYATVDQTLTPTAFAIDQDKTRPAAGKAVIVVAPRLHEPVQLNAYVTIIGDVVKADAEEIAKRMKSGANGLAEVLAQHPGRPVILATAVIDSRLNDLAKFIPPPMTPEEAVLDKAMKGVGAANGVLRKGVDAANAELVKNNAPTMVKAFADTEAFWKARGKAEAVKLAQDAKVMAQTIDSAAAMGNWNEAKKQMAALGQQCSACHNQFRERLEDGSFAVKREGGQ